jgi:peptidoglycan-N-acetylglucosamine deacetylase
MISIVIPALNEEKLLPGCLESLRNQDYCDEYEIIVADNGSNDKTADIAQSFGAKVIACPKKKSVFYARQVGADAARGDIMVQADADTVYPKDWLSRIASHFDLYPDIVALTGRYVYKDPRYWSKIEYLARYFVNRISCYLFGRPLVVSGATFAFRRRAFLEAGGYEGISYAPDQYGIADRLSKLGKIQYDHSLCILTSSRSIQKPLFIIMKDFLVHVSRWGIYIGKSSLVTQQSTTRRPLGRIAAIALSMPILVIPSVCVHGYFVPSSQVFGQVYHENSSPEKIVALTFDNTPIEPYTSEILDILGIYGLRATFFVSGENAALYPEAVKRIRDKGHVIGNNSYSRASLNSFTQHDSQDLRITQEIIVRTSGVIPHLYRPPRGIKTPWHLREIEESEMIPITWGFSIEIDEEAMASPQKAPAGVLIGSC